jgi:hypothetical protein
MPDRLGMSDEQIKRAALDDPDAQPRFRRVFVPHESADRSEIMSDRTDAYQTACKNRDAALEAVINACLPVVMLADILRSSPDKVQIVQIPQARGIIKAEVSFNGTGWPTATIINNALAEYHDALGELQAAWTNVRIVNEHHGLQPPPDDGWVAMRQELRGRASRPPR